MKGRIAVIIGAIFLAGFIALSAAMIFLSDDQLTISITMPDGARIEGAGRIVEEP